MAEQFVVDQLLPQHEVSVLAGAPGAGKSSIIVQMLYAMQKGESFLGMATKNVSVGYIAADRGMQSLNYWVEKVGLDPAGVKFFSLTDDKTVKVDKLETHPLGLLFDIINGLMPVELVVVDPMILFLGTDTKAYTPNAVQLIKLNKTAKRMGLTILGTHHATKARTDFGFKRPQDRISGSSALLGYTSTQIFLDTPEESGKEWYGLHVVSHTAPAMELKLQRAESGLFVPFEDVVAQPVAEVDVEALLLSLIPVSGVVAVGDLAAQLPHTPRRTVEFYLTKLKKQGLLVQPMRGMYAREVVGTA